MAKGEPLSNYQRKIVDRYYEHLDTITLTKLSEAVSELYLCESEKKSQTLWKTVLGGICYLCCAPERERSATGDTCLSALLLACRCETKNVAGPTGFEPRSAAGSTLNLASPASTEEARPLVCSPRRVHTPFETPDRRFNASSLNA